MSVELWQLGVLGLCLLISWFIPKIASHLGKWHALQEVLLAVPAFCQHAKDGFLAELALDRDPSSDGGTEITANELRLAREHVIGNLMGSLSGGAKSLIADKGQAWLHGLVGIALDKVVEKIPALSPLVRGLNASLGIADAPTPTAPSLAAAVPAGS